MDKKKLEFGQTPWDSLSKEELLRTVQQMWSAINSAYSIVEALHTTEGNHPYWKRHSTGGIALARLRQVITPIEEHYDPEEVSRRFFRMADSLLFEDERERWVVCANCGDTVTPAEDQPTWVGTPCRLHSEAQKCSGIYRKLTWDDLKPDQHPV